MDIVFFGTSEFAVPSLRAIANSRHKVLAVITRPDKKGGRGMQVLQSPVRMEAGHLRLQVHQPQDVSSKETIKLLEAKKADLFVVIAYGAILKKHILDVPKKYCINLHPSLLPKYRGAAPCNWTIINGEQTTGVTIIKLNEKLDAGDIITAQSIHISKDDTSEDIYNQLAHIGAETVLATLGLIESNKESLTQQDEKQVTQAPKLKKEDGLINWKNEADKIANFIHGTQPWPGAYTVLDGKLLKIFKVDKLGQLPNFLDRKKLGSCPNLSTVIEIEKDSFTVACGKGALKIKEVQLEGKKRMSAEEFLRGVRIEEGQKLG